MEKFLYYVLCSSKSVPEGQVCGVEIWVGIETSYEPNSTDFSSLAIKAACKMCPSVPAYDWVVSEWNGPHDTRADKLLGREYSKTIAYIQKAAEPFFAALKETGYEMAVDCCHGDYHLTAIPGDIMFDTMADGCIKAEDIMAKATSLTRNHLVSVITNDDYAKKA